MALIEHNRTEDGKYELKITIDPERFGKAVDKVYRRENKKINIPGFRKGKAPRSVIERMYGEGFFYEDAINDLLPEEFDAAVKEADIEMVGRPEVDVEDMNKQDGAKVKFTVTLRPELTVKKYKGLEAKKSVHTVEDSDIAAELATMQEKGSRIVDVDGRAAETGDIAVIDFEGFKEGVPFEGGKGEKFNLTLGSGQFIPGFEEQVVGHGVGDAFDVNVTFPEEYGAKELAGQAVVFKVKLHELKKKELPELDDEFAKDVSEFDTLAELKADIKANLEKKNEESAAAELENGLLEQVVEALEGEVPEAMIEDKVDEMVREFDYRLRSQGLDMQTYLKYMGGDVEAFRNSYKENAEKQVKSRLALEAVARAEKFEATEQEIEDEFKKLAESYKMEVEKLRELLTVKEISADIKCNKAVDFIKGSAKVVEEKVKAGAEKAEKAVKKAAAKKTADKAEKPEEKEDAEK